VTGGELRLHAVRPGLIAGETTRLPRLYPHGGHDVLRHLGDG
jgi:hypothetical protein